MANDGKKDVITHADVMAGRGVKKEETDLDEAEKKKASAFDAMAAAVKARRDKEEKEKGTGKFDKKELAPGRMQYTRKSSTYSEQVVNEAKVGENDQVKVTHTCCYRDWETDRKSVV